MNKYNLSTSAKYELLSHLLGIDPKSVKKYFYSNKKSVHDCMDVKALMNKRLSKKMREKNIPISGDVLF